MNTEIVSPARRRFVSQLSVAAASLLLFAKTSLAEAIETLNLSDAEWKKRLTDMQYKVLRHEATEKPFSSPLYTEHRKGVFHCAGCDLALFTSDMKYDSGTGWPSFFKVIEGRVKTKKDFSHIFPRTEYHCARCGGHHGHLFDDGPQPTGLRYCNNGVALIFKPV